MVVDSPVLTTLEETPAKTKKNKKRKIEKMDDEKMDDVDGPALTTLEATPPKPKKNKKRKIEAAAVVSSFCLVSICRRLTRFLSTGLEAIEEGTEGKEGKTQER